MIRKTVLFASALMLVCTVQAGVVIYSQDPAGYGAASGGDTGGANFDAIVPGTDISGQIIGNIQFLQVGAALLVVDTTATPGGFVDVIDPTTNQLWPTTPNNVVSPGGPVLGPGSNPSNENDSILLNFLVPVSAFGFDLLSQSVDGISYVGATVYDQFNNQVYSGLIPISNAGGGGAPGGYDFWGAVGTSGTLISSILIDETDNDAHYPDSNIGYDTLRYTLERQDDPGAVPEPAALALVGTGLIAVALLRRSR